MFREVKPTTEAIIELIRTLPDNEQKVIAQTLIKKKKIAQKPSDIQLQRKDSYKRMERFLKNRRGTLPKNFKFNREEANSR